MRQMIRRLCGPFPIVMTITLSSIQRLNARNEKTVLGLETTGAALTWMALQDPYHLHQKDYYTFLLTAAL